MDKTDVSVAKIIDTLVFPENKPCLRYNDGAASTRTACQNLTSDYSLNWNNANTDRAIKQTDNVVFLFRDPLRSVIFYDHNVDRRTYIYQIKCSLDLGDHFLVQPGCSGYFLPGDQAPLQASSNWAPHGNVLFPADCNGIAGYWCDNDGSGNYAFLENDIDDATTLNGGQFEYYAWVGNKWVLWASTPMTDGNSYYFCPTAPPVGGAYMAVAISLPRPTTCTQLNSYRLATTPGGGPSTWCHRAAPQIETLLPTIASNRIIAASVKWENLSAALDESGKITAVTVMPGIPWSNIASGATTLSGLQGYRTLQAKGGYYGFTQPTEDQMEWQDSVTQSFIKGQTQITNAWFKPCSESPYIAVGMSIANTAARDTSLTVTHMIEILTNSKTQETHTASASSDTWSEALTRLAAVPNHYPANVTLNDIFTVKRQRV